MATDTTSRAPDGRTPRPGARRRVPGPAAAVAAALLVTGAAAGCFKSSAFGNANTLIVVTSDDSLWRQVEDTTFAALEPTTFTVREEKKFYVQSVDTASTDDFSKLKTFKQVLIFGTPENRFVRRVADEADEGEPRPGETLRAGDVWAEGQVVTAVVLDPDDPAGSWRAALPGVAEHIDREYRRFIRRRMYTTGPDSTAADSLEALFGFRLRFPRVYDVRVAGDGEGPIVVRNDNPTPSQLIRSLLVDWRSPPLDTLTAERAYAWRASVDSVHYNVPQGIDTTRRSGARRLEVAGRPALEVKGVWSDEGTDFPAGGPFITRLVQCPGRTYFLDAWLYAPGKDKYQYILQLRELLDGFSCG